MEGPIWTLMISLMNFDIDTEVVPGFVGMYDPPERWESVLPKNMGVDPTAYIGVEESHYFDHSNMDVPGVTSPSMFKNF